MHASPPATLLIPRRQVRSLDSGEGLRFACRQGSVWITVDGDLTDYVLERGETFFAPPHARALVYALADARVDLVA